MDNNKPVAGATAWLLQATDSLPAATAVTNATGRFIIQKQLRGSYLLRISCIGYQPYFSKVILANGGGQAVELGEIPVIPAGATQLKAVTVTAIKPFAEHKLDRTVINIDALATNQGISTYDVLEKSPGILIDPVNGSISLEGRSGVTVYIDDRKSNLSGADLAAYLQSLPSGAVQTIELITNPPAKYDASGGPVINIRLKKNIAKGFTGGASALYGHWRYGKTEERFNFDYRHGKFNFFGSAGINQQNYSSKNYQDREYLAPGGNPQSYYSLYNFSHGTGFTLAPQVNIDYYANEKNTWGIAYNQVYRPVTNRGETNNTLSGAGNQPDSSILQNFSNRRIFRSEYVNLNYRHQFNKKDEELTADVDYNIFSISNNQLFNNSTVLPNQHTTGENQQTGNTPSSINIYAFRTDYTNPLKNDYKLETGLKTSITNTGNVADYFNIINNVSQPDYTKTNNFLYDENINAAYLNITKEWKRFSAEAGLRAENTIAKGHQLGNAIAPDSSFTRHYTGVFPTLFLQYKMDSSGTNLAGLTYGRRIDRPFYQDLNPFIIPEDNFNYDVGNPYLQPSYTNNVELSYVYKNNLTIKSFYATSAGNIQVVNVLKGNIIYSTYQNLGRYSYTGFSASGSLAAGKWFQLNGFAQIKFEHTEGIINNTPVTVNGTVAYLQGNMQFKPGKGWNAELNGFYQSGTRNIQFKQNGVGRINVVVQKKLSAHFTARVVFTDFLGLFKYGGSFINLPLTNATYKNTFDTRGFNISLNYRFGKAIKDLRHHSDEASSSEQGRVKN